MKKRMGYLKLHETVTMEKRGLTVWAYGKKNNYVGRIEISRAGLAAYTGTKGKKRIANLSWEQLFERLAEKK
jgi:hypothetical protein